jgi:amino acid transporter
MVAALLRTKSLSDIQATLTESEGSDRALKRTLTTFDLVMLGIGAVIGAGIFSSIGTAAVGEVAADGTVTRYGAGPALILSFVLLGAVCALAGLCYAELTALIPISGSAYTYAYATLGEMVAWTIGWDLILEYAVGNAAVGHRLVRLLLVLPALRLPLGHAVLALPQLPRRDVLLPGEDRGAAHARAAITSR